MLLLFLNYVTFLVLLLVFATYVYHRYIVRMDHRYSFVGNYRVRYG